MLPSGLSRRRLTALATLFGKVSNAAAANKLGLTNPAEYRRQRAKAVEAGLLPG